MSKFVGEFDLGTFKTTQKEAQCFKTTQKEAMRVLWMPKRLSDELGLPSRGLSRAHPKALPKWPEDAQQIIFFLGRTGCFPFYRCFTPIYTFLLTPTNILWGTSEPRGVQGMTGWG